MTSPVSLVRLSAYIVPSSGTTVTVAYGPVQGGFIVNPPNAVGQGIAKAEVLWIDLVNPATLGENHTNYAIQPGERYDFPAGDTVNVTVTAFSAGHRFSGVLIQPTPPSPAPNSTGLFPPSGPVGLTKIIPSYLYQQYADDDDLQAFVGAYNTLAQQYLDWMNNINLPVYTSDTITGSLLDWVAEGLYGMERPALSSGQNRNVGPFNTYAYNTLGYNVHKIIGPTDLVDTSDDVFKRIITWNFFKGDGTKVNTRWLKRRIMRFLNGVNGTSFNVNSTYQISVTYGVGGQVNINLLSGKRTVDGGAMYNGFGFGRIGLPLNSLQTSYQAYPNLVNALVLKEAIDSGVLQLPIQYTYVVTI